MAEFIINPKSEDREARLTEVVKGLARLIGAGSSRHFEVENVRIGNYDDCDEDCDCAHNCDCSERFVRILEIDETWRKLLWWNWLSSRRTRVIFTVSSEFLHEGAKPESLVCTVANGINLAYVKQALGDYADSIGVPKVAIIQTNPEELED